MVQRQAEVVAVVRVSGRGPEGDEQFDVATGCVVFVDDLVNRHGAPQLVVDRRGHRRAAATRHRPCLILAYNWARSANMFRTSDSVTSMMCCLPLVSVKRSAAAIRSSSTGSRVTPTLALIPSFCASRNSNFFGFRGVRWFRGFASAREFPALAGNRPR